MIHSHIPKKFNFGIGLNSREVGTRYCFVVVLIIVLSVMSTVNVACFN